ncbi:unnamed protein product [Ceutorhynchus assimilis]|uniref:O-acyltransferase WSD1 C-terminal domain-containing protein n=1 Tax=Ceutorhynchus assimilis TaxID=467358 RepID=A0A9N9MEG3_9CUCU|nr:unnamed protein product [Ceutorhynchus assimilis]
MTYCLPKPIKFFLLNLAAWLTITPTVVLFKIYKKIIHLILEIKHGKSFGGMMDCSDAFFCLPGPSKCCITVLLIVRSKKEIDLLNILRDIFKEKVFNHPDKFPKLTSTLHFCSGYPYWQKDDVKLDDAVRLLKLPENEIFTEECLKRVTGEITNSKNPKNDTILWDIHVSKHHLQGNFKDSHYRYPVVTRFHHSIGDGTALMALLIQLLAEENCQNYSAELLKKFTEKVPNQKYKTVWTILKLYIHKTVKAILLYLEVIFISLGKIGYYTRLAPIDVNALHGTNYSGDKIAVWAAEEKPECIPLVKKIKTHANSRFTPVLATALSASLTKFFQRNSLPIPDCTSGLIAQLLDFSFAENSDTVKLDNKSAGAIFTLHSTHKFKTLMDALDQVTKQMSSDMKLADGLINYFFLSKIFGNIPMKLLAPQMGLKAQTFLLTNVPGGSQIKMRNGCVIEKVIPFAPNVSDVGISFAVLTYDDRFHIGVLIDKSLKVPQSEVQKIANDILYYIKLMYIESKKMV